MRNIAKLASYLSPFLANPYLQKKKQIRMSKQAFIAEFVITVQNDHLHPQCTT
jgi:hypothetical protein